MQYIAARSTGLWSTTLAGWLVALAQGPAPYIECSQVLVFSEDFEGSFPGWSFTGSWVIADDCSGFYAPSCGQGKMATLKAIDTPTFCTCPASANWWNPCSGTLTSPTFQLPELGPGDSLELDFCLLTFVDGMCGYPEPFSDCNRLLITSPTKQRLYTFGGVIFPGYCPGPATTPPYDLAEFAGEVVTMQWIASCVDGEGHQRFTIDNVRVVHTRPRATSYCPTSPNSVGGGARIGSSGSSSVASNDLELAVEGAPPGQFGLFYFGDGAMQAPFGDGWRCVGGQVERLVPPLLISNDGKASRLVDFSAPPAAGTITAGSTWHFQLWYRDPAAGGTGFNLSDALRVTLCP